MAKVQAFMTGRGYVTPQDVKSTGMDVLRHRVIVSYEAEDEHDESAFVAEAVGELRRQGRDARGIAVFYRTNAQSRVLEETFVNHGQPYQHDGQREQLPSGCDREDVSVADGC